MSELWVVITDFNGFQQTRRCLEALRVSSYREFKTVVVDHGTTNETREGLREDFPEVVRLQGSPELWWAGAVNLGTRFALESGATHVVLLNNDCYVATDTIGTLARHALSLPGTIVAPIQRDCGSGRKEVYRPGSCVLLGFPTLRGPRRIHAGSSASVLIPVRLIVGGRGAIVPSTVFKQIGLFDDEQLPHYGADHDFYLRARHCKVGLYLATDAVVDVDGTRSSIANDVESLDLKGFLVSLRARRSHRNLTDISALFRKHYPVRGLYGVGVFLFLLRYLIVYSVRRLRLILVR